MGSSIRLWVGRLCIAVCVIALAACTNLAFNGSDQDAKLVLLPSGLVELERHELLNMSATMIFEFAADPASDATWTSSDSSVATVTGAGATAVVTAIEPGTTTVSVRAQGITKTIEVIVRTPHAVTFDVAPPQPTMPVGIDVQMTATAKMSDGEIRDVTSTATWASTQPSFATVAAGKVHGVAIGESTITAEFDGRFSSTRATVTKAVVVSIAVNPANPLVAKGTAQQFTAMGTFSNGTTSSVTTSVTWSSTDTSVATISNTTGTNGLAQTPAAGTTTIKATATTSLGTVVGMTTFMVSAAALTSITIAPVNPSTVAKSADVPFTATGHFSDNSTTDVTVQTTWSSNNLPVATISNAAGTEGIADAKNDGTVTITGSITTGGSTFTDTSQMTVVVPAVGAWTAEATFVGNVCPTDALKFSLVDTTGLLEAAYVCTRPTPLANSGGVVKGTVAANGTIAWAQANTNITNLEGLAISTHRQSAANFTAVVYTAVPVIGLGNYFRTSNGGTTWTAATVTDSNSDGRYLYAHRFQANVGNMFAGWDPTPQSVVVTQQGSGGFLAGTLGSSTGATVALAGSNDSSNLNLFAVASGSNPDGSPATSTGGVYFYQATGITTPQVPTWTARNGTDSGSPAVGAIKAADLGNLTSIVTASPETASAATTVHYVGVRRGARVYKTTDNGATWLASGGTGANIIPLKAEVTSLYIPPGQDTTIYAATTIGLYKSTDSGANWSLDGFQGRAVRGIGQSVLASSVLLVVIDDTESGDSPMYRHN